MPQQPTSEAFIALIRSEAFLQLGFPFLIRLGPFLDSRFRGNDPSRRQARRAKSNRSVKNASQRLTTQYVVPISFEPVYGWPSWEPKSCQRLNPARRSNS